MKLSVAIDAFIRDMTLEGRINSPATERDYRGTLEKHADDVSDRDPRYVGRMTSSGPWRGGRTRTPSARTAPS